MSLAKAAWLGCLSVAICLAGSTYTQATNLKAEEVISKNLDSLGTAQARAAAKSRFVQGPAQFKILMGGTALLDGTTNLVSQDRKLQLLISFDNNNYKGEQMICDGEKVEIAATTSRQQRSPFGEFVHSQEEIMREGLLGGELSTAWPLLNLDDRKPKLTYEGLKKIEGHQLYDIQYHPKKSSGDLEIHLYFEPDTFHHVFTIYKLTHGSGIGPTMTESSQQKETRYEIQERFSDFKTVGALTLPTRDDIQYTQENQNGHTIIWEWDLTASQISDNAPLDPKNFVVK